jgi:hypothetical protein
LLASSTFLLGLLLVVLTSAASEPARSEEATRRAQLEQLRKMSLAELEAFFRGLNPSEVRNRLGPPQRIARQFFDQGRLEQWVYDDVCRVEFLYPLGKEAHFQGVHPLSRR